MITCTECDGTGTDGLGDDCAACDGNGVVDNEADTAFWDRVDHDTELRRDGVN